MVYLNIFVLYLSAFFENFAFHPEMFVKNLKYMGVGMLCILIVIGIIIGLTLLLEKLSSGNPNKKNDQNNSAR